MGKFGCITGLVEYSKTFFFNFVFFFFSEMTR